MPLTSPDPGLKRLYYDARSPAKVHLVIQPGDTLEVSADVAAQLEQASGQFKTAVKKAAPVKKATAKKSAAVKAD
jgi:hypothetical protein